MPLPNTILCPYCNKYLDILNPKNSFHDFYTCVDDIHRFCIHKQDYALWSIIDRTKKPFFIINPNSIRYLEDLFYPIIKFQTLLTPVEGSTFIKSYVNKYSKLKAFI